MKKAPKEFSKRAFAATLSAAMVVGMCPSVPSFAVSGSEVAADGTYNFSGTVNTDDDDEWDSYTVSGTMIVSGGKITSVSVTPTSDIAYIFENETLRQTLEKMEHRKFSCIPILNPDGKYVGTISEGDLLWGMKNLNITDMKTAEEVPVMAISRRATYKPVHVDCDMEDLLDRAINQNFVPVIDDQDHFIGIVTRKEIIKYCYKEMQKNA